MRRRPSPAPVAAATPAAYPRFAAFWRWVRLAPASVPLALLGGAAHADASLPHVKPHGAVPPTVSGQGEAPARVPITRPRSVHLGGDIAVVEPPTPPVLGGVIAAPVPPGVMARPNPPPAPPHAGDGNGDGASGDAPGSGRGAHPGDGHGKVPEVPLHMLGGVPPAPHPPVRVDEQRPPALGGKPSPPSPPGSAPRPGPTKPPRSAALRLCPHGPDEPCRPEAAYTLTLGRAVGKSGEEEA